MSRSVFIILVPKCTDSYRRTIYLPSDIALGKFLDDVHHLLKKYLSHSPTPLANATTLHYYLYTQKRTLPQTHANTCVYTHTHFLTLPHTLIFLSHFSLSCSSSYTIPYPHISESPYRFQNTYALMDDHLCTYFVHIPYRLRRDTFNFQS